MKNLFDIIIEFITCPAVISLIGILSFLSAVTALFVTWRAYKLQQKSDKDLERIESNVNRVENNIKNLDSTAEKIKDDIDNLKSSIQKIETNIQSLSKISEQTQKSVKSASRTAFLVERTAALNKYPDSESFKEINKEYRPFIFSLFDDEECHILIKTYSNKPKKGDNYLGYKVQIIKTQEGIPKTENDSFSKFYFIKIIAPSDLPPRQNLKDYTNSPIKEGEYYACRFSETKCSWILGQKLSFGGEEEGFYQFCLLGKMNKGGEVKFANQIIESQRNIEAEGYSIIDKFNIDENSNFPASSSSLFKLFQKGQEVFFTIDNSPLKSIYTLKTWLSPGDKGSTFLVFENLRGYIKGETFLENLTNRILAQIKIKELPPKIDSRNFEKNHHIKVSLKDLL